MAFALPGSVPAFKAVFRVIHEMAGGVKESTDRPLDGLCVNKVRAGGGAENLKAFGLERYMNRFVTGTHRM